MMAWSTETRHLCPSVQTRKQQWMDGILGDHKSFVGGVVLLMFLLKKKYRVKSFKDDVQAGLHGIY